MKKSKTRNIDQTQDLLNSSFRQLEAHFSEQDITPENVEYILETLHQIKFLEDDIRAIKHLLEYKVRSFSLERDFEALKNNL
ncbi:MAG: hypothetical protein NWE89_12755 [Candidatus Bathyarchaeota archaeon]|nr:hypothetical protein [Candidatus Bathyarchaeota archaeon]